MSRKWKSIDGIYSPPMFQIKKGSEVKIFVSTNGDLDKFDNNLFGLDIILNQWAYPYLQKEVKPFKLLKYNKNNSQFEAILKYLKKSNELDELQLLCKDLMILFNNEGFEIINWKVESINN